MTEILTLGPKDAPAHIVLAHGAGAPMDSPFLETMADLLTTRGLRLSRFEFAYMAQRRAGGKRRPPPKAEVLIPDYLAVIEKLRSDLPSGQKLLIGGKSMGGRIASMCADELFTQRHICGLVCLGYPFHPPGKPDKLRTAHLEGLRCPALIVQGERDPLGSRAEVETYRLASSIRLHWAGDGNHDLAPRKASGFTGEGNLTAAADTIAAFASEQT